ncbi:Ig-like domain-containing protein [Chitinophaga lutea]
MYRIFLFLLAAFLTAHDLRAQVIYVNHAATGANDGSSWADAYTKVSVALNAASAGNEVWVAEGIYTPGTLPGHSFAIPSGVKLLGGFAGNETNSSQRDWNARPTLLSGEIGTAGQADNSNVIIQLYNSAAGTRLDGFTISGSYNTGYYVGAVWVNADGGPGDYAPEIFNCRIIGNTAGRGGGAANFGANGRLRPIYRNCLFENNSSAQSGGAVHNFTQNGAIVEPVFENCIFSKNYAPRGGAICNTGDGTGTVSPSFINCTLYANSSDPGTTISYIQDNQLAASVTSLTVYNNCISTQHTQTRFNLSNVPGEKIIISQSVIEGLGTPKFTSINNLSGSPMLRNPAAGDFRLERCSPAVNYGDNLLLPAGLTTDMAGDARIIDGKVDAGAFEAPLPPDVLYVNSANTAAIQDGLTWATAFADLQKALACKTKEVWVAAGTYKPTTGTDRTIAFSMPGGAKLYGGFAGTETDRSQRDWRANATILSGDIGVAGMNTDNSNTIVRITDAGSVVLDGFTITQSSAVLTPAPNSAIVVMPAASGAIVGLDLSNCMLKDNTGLSGGGLYLSLKNAQEATINVDHCMFSNNVSMQFGGAAWIYASPGTSSVVRFQNTVFYRNSAANTGGGVYCSSTTATRTELRFVNCTATGNTAPTGAFLTANANNTPNFTAEIVNSILWENGTNEVRVTGPVSYAVRNSIIRGGLNGGLDKDPLFNNAAGNDLRLKLCSPAINAGDNTAATWSDDIAGDARVQQSLVDMGAYEHPKAKTDNPTVTDISLCEGVTNPAALTATGTDLLWYAGETGGTGDPQPPAPTTTTAGAQKYYVTQTIGGCESDRQPLEVEVLTRPVKPAVTTAITYCAGEPTSELSATGDNLLWYDVPAGGTGDAAAPKPSSATVQTKTYYVTQTNTDQCESERAAIDVTVNATPAAPVVTSTLTYCSAEQIPALTAQGNGLLWYADATGGRGATNAPFPSQTKTYYVSQTDNGCESARASIDVTVKATPATPEVTSTLTYCSAEQIPALTAQGNGLLWYADATGGSGATNAPVPTQTKTYYVSQTDNGCESARACIDVTVKATPATPVVTSTLTYCSADQIPALTAQGNGLLWYADATGGSGATNAPVPTQTKTYHVSQTDNGCESARASIHVTVKPTPGAPLVNGSLAYCSGEIIPALTAQGNGLLWYVSRTGGSGQATAPTPTATGTWFVSQTANGCESERSAISVAVNPRPAAPRVVSPLRYCWPETPAALEAEGNQLVWYASPVGGTGETIAPRPSGSSGNATYYVSQHDGTCESARSAILVEFHEKPHAMLQTGDVCEGVDLAVRTTAVPVGASLTWDFDGGLLQTGSSVEQPVVRWSHAGQREIGLIVEQDGCRQELSQVLHVRPMPSLSVNAPTGPVCKGSGVTLQALGAKEYRWAPAEGLSSATAASPVFLADHNRMYQLTGVSEYGCISSIFYSIDVREDCVDYVMPNAFTPNGDGRNDVFRVPVAYRQTESFELSVFDRWGAPVFSTRDPQVGWTGTIGGKPAPAGSYLYVMRLREVGGRLTERSGHVVLLR